MRNTLLPIFLNTFTVLLTTAVLIFSPGLSPAAPLSPADRDIIELQQRQLLQQNRQQRDELEKQTEKPSAALPSPVYPGSGPCVTIHQITVSGAPHLSEKRRKELVTSREGNCLTLSDIQALTDAITGDYLHRGFITSRAFLTEQDLSGGILSVAVTEGTLEDITLEGEKPLILKTAFPGMTGRILNLRDIEQGMEQINRLRQVPVRIDILPGSQPGTSRVNLTAEPEFPVQGGISFDNSGQKSTGEKQIGVSLTGNNLLRLGDRSFVSVTKSSDFSPSRDAVSLQTGISLPYGYSLLDYSYVYSGYDSLLTQRGYHWYSRGNTQTHRLSGYHTLYRDSDMKTAAAAGLSHRIIRNYLNDVRLNSSSRTLTSVSLGINHSQKLWRGYATLNPAVSRGVPWFGGEDDRGKQSSQEPAAEFTKWSVSGSYYLPLTDNITWLTSFYGQWSPDRLYAGERLILGGESSVRGFKEQYLSGDNGGYWRNEISWKVLHLPVAGDTGFTVAADGGRLAADNHDPRSGGTLWGASAGLWSRSAFMTNQLTAGVPLVYPQWLKPDPVSVYYRISFTF